jgi:hypothetical protein
LTIHAVPYDIESAVRLVTNMAAAISAICLVSGMQNYSIPHGISSAVN